MNYFRTFAKGEALRGNQRTKRKAPLISNGAFLHMFLLSYFLNFLISSLQYLLAANDIDALLHLAQTLTSKIVYGSLILHF